MRRERRDRFGFFQKSELRQVWDHRAHPLISERLIGEVLISIVDRLFVDFAVIDWV